MVANKSSLVVHKNSVEDRSCFVVELGDRSCFVVDHSCFVVELVGRSCFEADRKIAMKLVREIEIARDLELEVEPHKDGELWVVIGSLVVELVVDDMLEELVHHNCFVVGHSCFGVDRNCLEVLREIDHLSMLVLSFHLMNHLHDHRNLHDLHHFLHDHLRFLLHLQLKSRLLQSSRRFY